MSSATRSYTSRWDTDGEKYESNWNCLESILPSLLIRTVPARHSSPRAIEVNDPGDHAQQGDGSKPGPPQLRHRVDSNDTLQPSPTVTVTQDATRERVSRSWMPHLARHRVQHTIVLRVCRPWRGRHGVHRPRPVQTAVVGSGQGRVACCRSLLFDCRRRDGSAADSIMVHRATKAPQEAHWCHACSRCVSCPLMRWWCERAGSTCYSRS